MPMILRIAIKATYFLPANQSLVRHQSASRAFRLFSVAIVCFIKKTAKFAQMPHPIALRLFRPFDAALFFTAGGRFRRGQKNKHSGLMRDIYAPR
jgi:hypothetical protein